MLSKKSKQYEVSVITVIHTFGSDLKPASEFAAKWYLIIRTFVTVRAVYLKFWLYYGH